MSNIFVLNVAILKYLLYLCRQMVCGKPTQDNYHANYRHRLSWYSLERRNMNITLLKAGKGKYKDENMIAKLALAKTEETFMLLGEYIPGYNKDRALNGIGLRLRSQQKCEEYAAELRIAIDKAKREQVKLKGMQGTYNYEFPSKNKSCLTTPHILYNTIRSSIAEMKKSILKFCPKNSRRATGVYTTPTQTLSNSYLCNQTPYSNDLYPDVYPNYVHGLLDLLDAYIQIATENINICQNLLAEESSIRNDDDSLLEIDMACREELEELAASLHSESLLSAEGISEEDLERRRKEAKSIKQMRRMLYHNITPKEYRVRVFKDFIMQGLANDLTEEESKIWTKKEDYDHVKQKVRPAIGGLSKNTDLPSTKQRNGDGRVVKADYIACFMVWCRVPKSKNQEFLNYLALRFTDSPLLLPAYTSVRGAAKKKLDKNVKAQYEADFESYSQN